MNKNYNLNKINQIILLSQNYSAHKRKINEVKFCVDNSSPQRNNHHQKLISQHQRYANAVKTLKVNELNESNRKFS